MRFQDDQVRQCFHQNFRLLKTLFAIEERFAKHKWLCCHLGSLEMPDASFKRTSGSTLHQLTHSLCKKASSGRKSYEQGHNQQSVRELRGSS